MIKKNELRIGNVLFIPGLNRYVFVTAIFNTHFRCRDSEGIEFEESVRVNYQPIPLTPEILEKWCGFTKANEEGVTTFTLEISKENIAPSGNNDYKLFGIKSKGRNSIQIDYTVNRYWAAKSIHYLHELQNLYLWITGEELEIKLENKTVSS